MEIVNIRACEVLDSRGIPTVEAEVVLKDGSIGHAIVPSGLSKGIGEALELRDGGKRHNGMGVAKAVQNVNTIIKQKLLGIDAAMQEHIDQTMIDLDGTPNKSVLGANAILSVSIATLKAAAKSAGKPLYQYISNKVLPMQHMPMPMINVINGGMHADNKVSIQESMIIPVAACTINEAMEISMNVIRVLKNQLKRQNHATNVGDEGGFAPDLQSNKEVLDYIMEAIKKAGYEPGRDVAMAIDVAASSLYNPASGYTIENQTLSNNELLQYYVDLCRNYPIISIEDGMAETDYCGWELIMTELGNKINIVGDDLFTTNSAIIAQHHKLANSTLIKYNQVGTITETLQAIASARQHNHKVIISHRSGETEDNTIAHLAFGVGADYIKAGSICRSERVAKYNEMLRIEANKNNNL